MSLIQKTEKSGDPGNARNNKKEYLKEYAEYNTFDYQTYKMHMTCENSVVTSNLYKKSSHFALF